MRSAAILGKVEVPKIDDMPKILEFAKTLDGYVDEVDGYRHLAKEILGPICDDAFLYSLCATMGIGPHTDDELIGDVSVGVVLSGDHYLFTGNGRRVGTLAKGTVFALLNKKQHGACQRNRENPTPLIFAVCEPKVPAEEWKEFCNNVVRRLS